MFNGGKWNGLKIKPAYITRLFKSFSGIYRSPLYMKAIASYKVTTKKVLRKKKKWRKKNMKKLKKTPKQKFLAKNKGIRKVHWKPSNKISFAYTESKSTHNRQINQLTQSTGWCLMNELSFIRNSAASFLSPEATMTLWFSVGEAYFICRFSVHFSYAFVFIQKLLFWSFFNFFIFFIC